MRETENGNEQKEMEEAGWGTEVESYYQSRVQRIGSISWDFCLVISHLFSMRNWIEEWLAQDPCNGALNQKTWTCS